MDDQDQEPPNNNNSGRKPGLFCNLKLRDPETWWDQPPSAVEKRVKVLEAKVVLLESNCEVMSTTIKELVKTVEILKAQINSKSDLQESKDPLGSCTAKSRKRSSGDDVTLGNERAGEEQDGGCEERPDEPSSSRFKSEEPKTFSYRCTYCIKKFQYEAGLEAHIEVHRSQPPLECGYCEQLFKTSSNLKLHMSMHKDVMPYICSCGKRFGLEQALKLHQRVVHYQGTSNTEPCVFVTRDYQDEAFGTPSNGSSSSSAESDGASLGKESP